MKKTISIYLTLLAIALSGIGLALTIPDLAVVGLSSATILLIIVFAGMIRLLAPLQQFIDLNVKTKSNLQEVQTKVTNLETANEQLLRTSHTKDQILTNTSLELKTPINSILGITEHLLENNGANMSENERLNFKMIIASAHRMSNIVADLVDFSKMKTNQLEIETQPLDIRASLELTIGLLQSMIGKKTVLIVNKLDPLVTDVDFALPKVMANETRLQQIFQHILSNAIKFTEQGKIEIQAEQFGNFLDISILDSGIGIAKDRLERIFHTFDSTDDALRNKYGGIGIGLAVAKQLTELQGGKIRVESELGKWTRVTISFRIASENEMNKFIQSQNKTLQALRSSGDFVAEKLELPKLIKNSGMDGHILVVDDEPVNLQVIMNHLSMYQYKVTTAESGLEAMALLKGGLQPDLVLLDVMMPKLNGYETAKMIRSMHPIEQLPILLLTAKNMTEDIVTGFQSGANDYLVKPFNKMELLARIQTHLNLAKSHRHLTHVKARMAEMLKSKNVSIEESESA